MNLGFWTIFLCSKRNKKKRGWRNLASDQRETNSSKHQFLFLFLSFFPFLSFSLIYDLTNRRTKQETSMTKVQFILMEPNSSMRKRTPTLTVLLLFQSQKEGSEGRNVPISFSWFVVCLPSFLVLVLLTLYHHYFLFFPGQHRKSKAKEEEALS